MALDDTPSEELSPRQRRAVVALLAGDDPTAAAAAAGCSVRTLHRWKRSPAVREALAAGAREMFAEALALLRASAPAAAVELARLRREGSDAVKLRAAVAVFRVCQAANLEDLEARVAALEAAARLEPPGGPQ